MSPRSLRRAAKLLKRNPTQGEGQPVLGEPSCDRTLDPGREQPPKRHATGPVTAEGKAISCLNRLERAQRLQDDELMNGSERKFDVFLRYQTADDRFRQQRTLRIANPVLELRRCGGDRF